MGNSNSTRFYDDFKKTAILTTVVRGGCPCIYDKEGGKEEEENIEELIRLMFDCFKQLFKFSEGDSTKSSIPELMEIILTKIPEIESKSNISLSKISDDVAIKVSDCLENVINNFKSNTITAKDINEKFKQIIEFIYSVSSKLREKYLSLESKIQQAELNLEKVKELINELLNTKTDGFSEQDVKIFMEILRKLKEFENKESQHLKKLVTIFIPKQYDFEKYLNPNEMIDSVKKRIANLYPELTPGAVSILLSIDGLKNICKEGGKYLQGLQVLNITIDEYAKNVEDFAKFKVFVADKALQRLEGSRITDDLLDKILEAVNYINNEEPVKVADLKKSVGAAEESFSSVNNKTVQIILNAFVTKFSYIFNKIRDKVKDLSKNVFKISYNNLSVLRQIYRFLDQLPKLTSENIFIILSGICTDVNSTQNKDLFVNTLQQIVDKFTVLVKDKPELSIMKEIRDLFESLINVIKTFETQIKSTEMKIGGDDLIATGVVSITNEIDKLKHQIMYYIKLISLLTSLHNEAEVVKYYSPRVGEVDGRWVAELRDDLHSELKSIVEKINKVKSILPTSKECKHNIEALIAIEKHIKNIKEAKDNLWKTGESFNEYLRILYQNSRDDPYDKLEKLSAILYYNEVGTIMISPVGYNSLWKLMETWPGISDGVEEFIGKLCKITPDLSNAHYYILLAISNDYSNYSDVEDSGCADNISQEIYDEIQTKFSHTIPKGKGLPGNPLIPLPIIYNDTTLKKTENRLDIINNLLNSVLLDPMIKNFWSLVFGIGYKEINAKEGAYMSTKTMYGNIIKYIKYSSVIPTLQASQSTYTMDYETIFGTQAGDFNYDNKTFKWGNISGNHINCEEIRKCLKTQSLVIDKHPFNKDTHLLPEVQWIANVILRPIQDFEKTSNGASGASVASDVTPVTCETTVGNFFNSMFAATDDLLINMMRAGFVKIISSVRMISTLSEQHHDENLTYNSTMRAMVGAAELDDFTESTVFDDKFIKVLIRLPLLIELAQKIYNFNEDNKSYDYVITPMMGDEFYKLFELINYSFLTNNETYPTEICNNIIKMLYKIVQNHPHDDDLTIVTKAWQSFVKRITLVSRLYIKEYIDALRGMCKQVKPGFINEEIMLKPVDSSSDSKFSTTPSSKYMKNVSILDNFIKPENDSKRNIPKLTLREHYDIIEGVCKRFDYCIKKYAPNLDKDMDYTLDEYIANVIGDVNNSKSLLEKMDILRRTLREGLVTGLHNMLILIGFNENVVAPLTHLYGVYNILNDIFSKIDKYAKFVDIINDKSKPLKEIMIAVNVLNLDIIRAGSNYVSEPYEYEIANINWNAVPAMGQGNFGYLANDNNKDPLSLPIRMAMYSSTNQFPLMWRDLLSLINKNANSTNIKLQEYVKNVYKRYAVNSHKLFIKLYEIIQSFNMFNGYTTVNIINNKIELNIKNLVSDITETFAAIGKNVAAFLPHVNKQIYERYTSKTINGVENKGSYYWLMDKLLNTIILDNANTTTSSTSLLKRRTCEDTNVKISLEDGRNGWLLNLNSNIQQIMDYLKTPWTVNARVIHYHQTENLYLSSGQINFGLISITNANKMLNDNNIQIPLGPPVYPCLAPNHTVTVDNTGNVSINLSVGALVDTQKTIFSEQKLHVMEGLRISSQNPAVSQAEEYSEPFHGIPLHAIGFPADLELKARSVNKPNEITTIQEDPNNYFKSIMSLLYLNFSSLNYIPSNHMHPITNPTVFKVDNLNNIFNFAYNRGNKKLNNIEVSHSFIPNIFGESDPNSFVSFYHGSNGYNQYSPRSIIMEFNQLFGLLLENITQIPFDKIFIELIMDMLDAASVEIGNYKENLKDILVYQEKFKENLNKIIIFGKNPGGQPSVFPYNYVMMRDKPANSAPTDTDKLNNAVYDPAETEKMLNSGFYTEPLINQYWNTSVLSQSISVALWQIQQVKGSSDKPLFIEQDVNELSSYYKEKLKTILTIFRCYFTTLLQRTTVFTNFISNFKYYQRSAGWCYSTDVYAGRSDIGNIQLTSDLLKRNIQTRCNNVSKYCNVILKCIYKTLQILHDKPILGELTIPCNPMNTAILPSFLTVLYQETRNTWTNDELMGDNIFIPQHPLGDSNHKIQCALRYFFSTNFALDGNQYCTPVLMNIDPSSLTFGYEGTLVEHEMKKITTIIPKMVDWKVHLNRSIRIALFNVQQSKINRLFTYCEVNKMFVINDANNTYIPYNIDILHGIDNKMKFPLITMKPNDIIDVLSTKTLPEQYKTLFSHYSDGGDIIYNRDNLRITNIIDAGIMPVAAHMFMNDTPFSLILYYSVMFPKVIDEVTSDRYSKYYINNNEDVNMELSYDLQVGANETYVTGGCPCEGSCDGMCGGKSTDLALYEKRGGVQEMPHDLFVKLLKNPYMPMSFEDYSHAFKHIMRGEIDELDLLAPKFLDKPLYDVLLGDLRDGDYVGKSKSNTKQPLYTYDAYTGLCMQRLKFLFENHCSFIYLSPLQNTFNICNEKKKFHQIVGGNDNQYKDYMKACIGTKMFGGGGHKGINRTLESYDVIENVTLIKHIAQNVTNSPLTSDTNFAHINDMLAIHDAEIAEHGRRLEDNEKNIATISSFARTVSDDTDKKFKNLQKIIDDHIKFCKTEIDNLILRVDTFIQQINNSNQNLDLTTLQTDVANIQAEVTKIKTDFDNQFANLNKKYDDFDLDFKDENVKIKNSVQALSDVSIKLREDLDELADKVKTCCDKIEDLSIDKIMNFLTKDLLDILNDIKEIQTKLSLPINAQPKLDYWKKTHGTSVPGNPLRPTDPYTLRVQQQQLADIAAKQQNVAAAHAAKQQNVAAARAAKQQNVAAAHAARKPPVYSRTHIPQPNLGIRFQTGSCEEYTSKGVGEEILYHAISPLKEEEALLRQIFSLFPNNMTYERVLEFINEHFYSHAFHNCIYDNYVYEYYLNLIMWFVSATIALASFDIQEDLIRYLKKNKTTLEKSFNTYITSVIFNIKEKGYYLLENNVRYENSLINKLRLSCIAPDNYIQFKRNIRLCVAILPTVKPYLQLDRLLPLPLESDKFSSSNNILPNIFITHRSICFTSPSVNFDPLNKDMYQKFKAAEKDLSHNLTIIKSSDFDKHILLCNYLYKIYNDSKNDLMDYIFKSTYTDGGNASINKILETIPHLIRLDMTRQNTYLKPIPALHIPMRFNPNLQNSQYLFDDNNNFLFSPINSLDESVNRCYVCNNLNMELAFNIDTLDKYPTDITMFEQNLSLSRRSRLVLLDLTTFKNYKDSYNYFVYMFASLRKSVILAKDWEHNLHIVNKNDIFKIGNSDVKIINDPFNFNNEAFAIHSVCPPTFDIIHENMSFKIMRNVTDCSHIKDLKLDKVLKDITNKSLVKFFECIVSAIDPLTGFESGYGKTFNTNILHITGGDINSEINASLHFYSNNKPYTIHIGGKNKKTCQLIGYFRFNTTLIRLLIEFQNLVRLSIREIRKALTKRQTEKSVTGLAIGNFNLTEEDLGF